MSAASSSWESENKENVPTAPKSGKKVMVHRSVGELQSIHEQHELEPVTENTQSADILGAIATENMCLRSRIAELEAANQAILCNKESMQPTSASICTNFSKGCDISRVFVDNTDELNATWFCRYIATGSFDDLYISDESNHVVRQIGWGGRSTTIAGSGAPGYKDGYRAEAKFNKPKGIAVSPGGTVYVSDWGNDAVRRISPEGRVDTLAGRGTPGFDDGTGREARFSDPHGCAIGPDGSVYVCDFGNHSIRRISPGGTVSTIAGSGSAGFRNGQGCFTQFHKPTGVAVDSHSNVYVADYCNHVIRRIAVDGTVKTLGGSGTPGFKDGAWDVAQFKYPTDVAVDSDGVVYVVDYGNHAVRCIFPRGAVATIARCECEDQEFYSPEGIALRADGSIYIMNRENKCIQKITIPTAD
eukprot:GEMP01028112.1.p1 GENE.GEMP01028112.1~~GEMP01028112.1.p1  ORF type:complete len:459 (+),score=93.00 GEMP01028112.1:134-1378(+)